MVIKELAASAYHIDSFFNKTAYIQLMNKLAQESSNSLNSLNSDNSQLLTTIGELQRAVVAYENRTSFVFDGNPLVALLSIENALGVGALENMKKLVVENPIDFSSFIITEANRIKNTRTIVGQLSSTMSLLPGYQEYRDLYKVNDGEVLVRVRFADGQASTVSDSYERERKLNDSLRAIEKLDKDSSSYNFRILTLAQSSPQEIAIITSAHVAIILNIILKSILKRWKEFEEIRQIRAKTENLKVDTKEKRMKIDHVLEAIDDLHSKDNGEAKILADKLVEGGAEKIDGAPAEVSKDLERSITHIESIIADGGTVNVQFIQSQYNPESTKYAELAPTFKESKVLQRPVAAVEKLLGEESK